jgi:AcrR family transcriptional regulator
MPPPGPPKFKRRKAERPEEIVQSALEVFAAKGFAAARLDDIAARAGISKGALYLYFATKEDLFLAVVKQAVAPNVQATLALAAGHPGPFADLVEAVAGRMGQIVGETPIGSVAKMVIGEARNFPEIARVWHDELVGPALAAMAGAIASAQARGEVVAGDPRAFALSLIGPILVGVVWRETFVPVGAEPFDIPVLARQHARALLSGMLLTTDRAA